MRMDNQLREFFNEEITITPPFVNETKIIYELERRKKRKMIIWLSVASLLWFTLFFISAILIAKEDMTVCILLLVFAGIQIIAGGLLSFVVLKSRRVNQ